MLYDIIPNQLNLYDYEALAKNPTKFFAVATDCLTGKAEYFPVTEMHRDVIKVRASSSLPLLSRMVEINGRPYLDGGFQVSPKEVGFRAFPKRQTAFHTPTKTMAFSIPAKGQYPSTSPEKTSGLPHSHKRRCFSASPENG